VYWDADAQGERALPDPFPVRPDPLASDADFPPMPTLKVDVSWAEPLAADGEVWIDPHHR
jgi:hypothetical protein